MTSLGSIGLDVASWIAATVFEHDEGPWLDVVILSRELAAHAPEIAAALEPLGGASFPERHLFAPWDAALIFLTHGAPSEQAVATLRWSWRDDRWHGRPRVAWWTSREWAQMVNEGWNGGKTYGERIAEFESWLRPA